MLWKISPFCLGGVLSAMTAWGGGDAHIPRRAGGEQLVMPSFPARVYLALPIVCAALAGSCVLFMVSLASATKVRQKCDNGTKHEKIIHNAKTKKMTNYLLESKCDATQENHFVRICNQWVAGSTPVTSSTRKAFGTTFPGAFVVVGAERYSNSTFSCNSNNVELHIAEMLL